MRVLLGYGPSPALRVKSNFGAPLPTPKAMAAKQPNPKQPVDDELGLRGFGQPPLPLVENDSVIGRVRAADQVTLTRRYTERAVDFIRKRKDRPFFLYLAHSAVHFPLYPSEEYRGRSTNGLLGDWVQEVDASVGRVLETLRELKLDRNTLVLFVSDNGGPLNQGATNRPLRGGKGTTFEGGVRVVAMAWWPGKIPAGSSTDAMTSMMDVLPTFAQLANAPLPTNRKLDGVDVWPAISGSPARFVPVLSRPHAGRGPLRPVEAAPQPERAVSSW